MIPCQVNGVPRSFDGDPEMPLVWYLRDQLQLTGTKYGCGIAGTGTPAGAAERDAAAQTFQVHCAMCHGPDGKGDTVIGKSAHIPDLHAAAVQQQSDAAMAEFIANGKGVMPPFKNSLSGEQIHALVAHVRALAQQH